ncbi:MAG: YceD family protein, partial [Gemmatimonadaceae bacterium]
MLSFDIRSLERQAVHVDGALQPDDPIWEEADVRPSEPIRVTGRLSSAGEGRFYFTGRIEGQVELPCRLCLENVEVEVDEEVHFLLAEIGADEAEDPDVFLYDPNSRMLDLRGAVRETWLLTAPAFVQCREDCKGLCPTCGTNLNESTCSCTPTKTDSRWDALLNHQSK